MNIRPIMWILMGMILLAAGPSVAEEAAGGADAKSAKTVVEFTLRGGVPESTQVGLFGDLELSLAKLTSRLQALAADDKVSAAVIKIRSPRIGRGRLAEIQQAIRGVRDSGKRVIAHLETAATADYLLALACDEIVMPESGTLLLPGVHVEVTFYKGLLEKLGIEPDLMQVGAYKGAAEPYTRESMSDAFRAQYELFLDDVFDQLVDTVASNRKLEHERVRSLIDEGLLTASEALDAGLIDSLGYEDEMRERLASGLNASRLQIVRNYGTAKAEQDFSGMLGMMKLFEMMMGGKSQPGSGSGKKQLAIVYATGMITTGKSNLDFLGSASLGSETVIKAIREAEQDESVIGTILRVDSPGGSALASDLIWREIRQCRKPVFASMGDVAASGGYYIAMGCDQIFAGPGTITGSIGVVGGKLALRGLYEKLGIQTTVIRYGKNSGLLSGELPFSDTERKVWRKVMQTTYEQFLSKASEGRKLSREKLEELAGGRIWTGRQAQAQGLVDKLGTLADAISAMKAQLGIDPKEKIEILTLPRPVSFLDQLIGGEGLEAKGLAASVWGDIVERSPFRDKIGLAIQLEQLFREPTLCLMPYQVEVR